MSYDLADIAAKFRLDGDFASADEIGDGNINGTWKITCRRGDKECAYILQRINTYVFKDPEGVMRNIALVTDHVEKAYRKAGIPPEGRVLKVIPTRDSGLYYRTAEGDYFRIYNFIEGARAYNKIDSPASFREAGRGFGEFGRLLDDFPASQLVESIPGFHDTVRRFAEASLLL